MSLKAFILSLALHGAVFGLLLKPNPQRPIAIEVNIKTRGVAQKAKGLKLHPAKQAPRLGSDAYRYTHRKLGDTLASEHYLERLHKHIDPNWTFFVNRTGLKSACTTVLNIDADANGTVLTIFVAHSGCPEKLWMAAVDAVWHANLLPPPAFLLDSSKVLKLEWYFILKPKD